MIAAIGTVRMLACADLVERALVIGGTDGVNGVIIVF